MLVTKDHFKDFNRLTGDGLLIWTDIPLLLIFGYYSVLDFIFENITVFEIHAVFVGFMALLSLLFFLIALINGLYYLKFPRAMWYAFLGLLLSLSHFLLISLPVILSQVVRSIFQ